MPRGVAHGLTYGEGLYWSLSRVECHVFTAYAAHDGTAWNYSRTTAPNNCREALQQVLSAAYNVGIPRYVWITTGVALRLLTDPAFNLAGLLLNAASETTEFIEASLPISRRPLWLRIAPDHVPLPSSIVIRDKRQVELARL